VHAAFRRYRPTFPAFRAVKVDKHSTGGVATKTSFNVRPWRRPLRVLVPIDVGPRAGPHRRHARQTGSIPGFRTDLTAGGIREATGRIRASASSADDASLVPADRKLYALAGRYGEVESPLISSRSCRRSSAEGIDALVLGCQSGHWRLHEDAGGSAPPGGHDGGIGRRMDKKVQATDHGHEPAAGLRPSAMRWRSWKRRDLAGMRGPADLTKISSSWPRGMIFLRQAGSHAGRGAACGREAPGGRFGVQEVQAGGGGAGRQPASALTSSNCCPTPPGCAKSPRRAPGYVSRINAQDIGVSSNMIGAGRDKKEDSIDRRWASSWKFKMGEKVDAGSVLVRLYLHQGRPRGRSRRDGGGRFPHLLAETREAGTHPGSSRVMGRFTGFPGPGCNPGVAWLFSRKPPALRERNISSFGALVA